MAKRYAREVREEVLGKIRGGQKVADVARVYGIKKEEFSRLPTLENEPSGQSEAEILTDRFRPNQ